MRFHGVEWEGTQWRPYGEPTEQQHVWINDLGDATVALHVPNVPDIPPIGDADAERATQDYYRRVMASMNGGIVEIGYGEIDGLRAVRTIIKQPLEPRGF